MALLDIRPEALQSRAQQIDSLRQSDIETLTKIRSLILNLEDTWKGQAAEAYVNKYLSQQNSLNEFYNTLQEFVSLLKEAAVQANSIEGELISAVNQIG